MSWMLFFYGTQTEDEDHPSPLLYVVPRYR